MRAGNGGEEAVLFVEGGAGFFVNLLCHGQFPLRADSLYS